MKKSIKKVFSLVLVFAMTMTLLGGCGKKSTEKNNESENNSATGTAEVTQAPAIDTSTVEEFTVLVTGSLATGFNWDNPVAEEITKRTGVKLVPEICVDDPDQRVALMLSSGQFTDLVLNVNSALNLMIDSGDAIQLDDLIETYGPDLKTFYGDKFNRIRHTDGNIYSFGVGASVQPIYTPGEYWNTGFFLQNQALINQNYPSIKTPTDFENVIKAELAQNPTTEDGQKKYGISFSTGDGFRYQFSLTQPANLVNGMPVNGDFVYNKDTDKVELAMKQDYMKEYIRWYNKMYNEGLVDPESFTQNTDTWVSKISAGRVIGVINGGWEFHSGVQALRDANKGNEAYMTFAPTLDPSTMQWSEQAGGDVAREGGFFITSACKNPAKLVNFFNFLASEEGQILTECGIEGVNYTIDANGNRVQAEADKTEQAKDSKGYALKTGVGLYARDYGEFVHQPYGWNTTNGQSLYFVDSTSAAAAYSPEEKATVAKYGFEFLTDPFPKTTDLPERPYGDLSSLNFGTDEDVLVAKQSFDDSKLPALAKAIMCPAADFDATWDEYMAELDDMGLDAYLEKANEALQARLTQWGVK